MKNLNSRSFANNCMMHAILLMATYVFSTTLSAQTFPVPGFTLPAGKTIIITYEVDVNANVCPTGTIPTDISNQSNVSGSNFPTVLTDEPSNPAANPSPTLTPVAGLSLGNLVYRDLNSNGVFDAGDVGVNGVSLRLFLDDGDGVLDAGDGAALATTTTAGGGLYTFTPMCPGNYIVEIQASNFNAGGPLYDNGLMAALISSPVGGAPDPDNDVNNDDNGDPVAGFGVASAAITLSLGGEPINDGDADNNTNLSLDFGFKNPTTVSINDVTLAEGTGGSTTAFNFTVTRSIPDEAFSLTVNTADGTATVADADYTAISGGTVSFTAGGPLTQTVTVLVNHDSKVEPNETFTVILSGAPAGIIITDGTGSGTINNDDAAVVTLTGGVSQNEGTSFVFSATLNNPVQGGFSVAYTTNNGTATTADSDYTDNDGTLVFTGTAGEVKTITVLSTTDAKVELDETFTVVLGAITGTPGGVTTAGSPQTGTITNDDQATVTISNVSMNEGNAGNTAFLFTVTLTGVVDNQVAMNFATVDGSAMVSNADYISNMGAVGPFVANGPAIQTATITVQVVGDMTFEGNETFLVRLSSLLAGGRNVVFNPAGATLDGTGTILNDDIPPVIINELDADQPGTDAAEFVELYDGGVGNTSLTGMVMVFYNGSNDQSYLAIDLDGFTTNASGYFIAGNTGVPGVDAVFAGNVLQNGQDAVAIYNGNGTDFPNGTVVTTTNLIDALVYDTADPDDPGLLVLLNAGQPQVDEDGGGDATCHSLQRIPNGSGGPRNTTTYSPAPPTPDAANAIPLVSINVSPASVSEDGATDLVYTISRTGSTTCALSVAFTTSGTATPGIDFPALPTSPIIIPAASSSVTIIVNPTVDGDVENNETITIALVDGTSYDLGSPASATGTINNDDSATVTLGDVIIQNEGNAGTTTYSFLATLTGSVPGGFTVAYSTNNGTATVADNDYTDNDGTLIFAGTNNETKMITVLITGDMKVELDETFTVALGALTGPAGITIVGSPLTNTIVNDDNAMVSIAANVSQAENLTPQVFTVTLSNPVDVAVTASFSTSNGTASTADNDYTAVVNQTVTFAAGTTTSQTVNVTIINDNKVEGDEVFNATITTISAMGRNVTFGTNARTGTIVNDDSALVTFSGGGSANEGNTGTTPRVFSATLNNPVQGGFTIPYTTNDGTATVADLDYADNDGTLTFAGTSGEVQTVTVLVNGDFKVEADETYTVALGAIAGAPAGVTSTGSPQTATIVNDEVDYGDAPDPTFPTLLASNGARHNGVLGISLGATIDGEANGQPNPTASGDGADEDGVTLPAAVITGITNNITVNASVAGILNAWIDYNNNGSWADGGEQIFTNTALVAGNNNLTIAVPAGATPALSFGRFRFSTASGLSFTGSAADGEVEDYQINIQTNTFSINSPSVAEGNAGPTNLVYTVTRSTNTAASSVDYAITGGTATSGSDYQPLAAGTINFPAGGSLSATITVVVNGDVVVEDNETVIITLSNPVNGGIGTNPGTGTITNDDSATLTLTGGTSQNEGNAGTVSYIFTATLSAAVQGGFQIAYTTNNGTATTADNDYVDNDGALTFAGTIGETKTITVLVNGDTKVELNETFTVALGTITATTATQAAAITQAGSPQTGTITNDDSAIVSLSNNVTQAEATTPQVYNVTLSNPVDVAVTVSFNTANGTATTADNDYTVIVNQTVTFPAGTTTTQLVNVAIINDNKVEDNETYTVSIGNLQASGRPVTLGTTSGNGVILNDDTSTLTLSGGTAVAEGNTGTTPMVFNLLLSNPVQGGFTVTFSTNDGTATVANNDYQDNDGVRLFGGVAGEAEIITVLINGDLNIEPNETFTVTLGAFSGTTPIQSSAITIIGSPQTGTIINDELDWGDAPTAAQSGFTGTYPTTLVDNGARHILAPGGLRLGSAVDADLDGQPNATATGDGIDEDGVTLPGALVINTTANITVNSSGAGGLNAWVDFNRDGDWGDAGEFVLNNIAVVAGNNALSFAVPAGASLGNSFARFRVSTAPGAGFVGTAADGEVEDYAVNIVNTQFTVNDPSVAEGNAGATNLVFTITRTNNASACSIDYAITNGTATTADNDYQPVASGTATFTAGGALTQNVTVLVNGDLKVELDETVNITLSNPVNASILDGAGVGTIINDDQGVITITSPSISEGDVGTQNLVFNITMSNPSDANVVFNYATSDGTATVANNDYVATNGTHTMLPGETTKQVSVVINSDCFIEPNEVFFVILNALNNNGRNIIFSGGGASLAGTGTINNEDFPPVITCPANITISCEASTLPANTGTATATDDCTPAPTVTFTQVITPGSCVNNYVITRTWKATDGTNDMATCNQIITVRDITPPTITCPAPVTVQCAALVPAVSIASVISSDNCSPAPTVTHVSDVITNQTCINRFILNRTYRSTDVCGNSATCVQIITVFDNTSPVITFVDPLLTGIPNGGTLEVQCFGQDPMWSPPTFDVSSVTASDNCAGTVTVTLNDVLLDEGNCAGDGYINRHRLTWTATDACGNTSSAVVFVELIDEIAPVLENIPANITVSCDQVPDPPTDIFASDECLCNCDIVFFQSTPNPGCQDGQILTRTWTATDACGNVTTGIQLITLLDQQGPELHLVYPPLMGVPNGAVLDYTCEEGGIPSFYNSLGVGSIAGGVVCGDNPNITFASKIHNSNNCEFNGYIQLRSFVWTAKDICGNESVFIITVRLVDNVAPVLINVPEFTCIGDPSLALVEAIDNCEDRGNVRYWDVPIPNPCGSGTALRRTYEGFDGCGNTTRDTAILLPDDNIPPVMIFVNPDLANLPPGEALTVECTSVNGDFTDFGMDDISATDDCQEGMTIAFTETLIENGNCVNGLIASLLLEWTATDVCGNSSQLTAKVNVVDNTAPYIPNFKSSITIGCKDEIPGIDAVDDCSEITVTSLEEIVNGDCPFEYDLIRRILIVDACGNDVTYVQTIHVGDGSGPDISGVPEDACDDTSPADVTAWDPCAGEKVEVTMTEVELDLPCRDGTVLQRTWTAYDQCGNSSQAHQIIIIGDKTPPVIQVPTWSVIRKLMDNPSNTISLSDLSFMDQLNELSEYSIFIEDECDEAIIPEFDIDTVYADNCVESGYYEIRTYTWIATDLCGNSSSISFDVEIRDDVNPEFLNVPADITVICQPLPAPTIVQTSDYGQPVQVDFSESITNGPNPGEFNVTRTWTATDPCDNSTTFTQNIFWIPNTNVDCDILSPGLVNCNTHGLLINSSVSGGIGPYTYQWEIDGPGFIESGQGTPTVGIYIGFDDIDITLTVTDAYGCSSVCSLNLDCLFTFGGYADDVDGIEQPDQNPVQPEMGDAEIDQELPFEVLPNPTTGNIHINLMSEKTQGAQLMVYDFMGQIVYRERMNLVAGKNRRDIDLSSFAQGGYVVRIKTQEKVFSKTITIVR